MRRKLEASVNESSNKEIVRELIRLEKILIEGGHIPDKILDEHLCSETVSSAPGRQIEEDDTY